MTRLLLALLLSTAAFGETVRFKTSDGIEIVADYYKGKKDAPSVICIPMFRNVRASYRSLVLPLTAKGYHVLVIDTRGHGESAPDLAPRVRKRDASVFLAMHLDVEAGIAFLENEKGCDATRIGLVGASVGCSVAVDTTVRNPHAVRGVVLLTPGAKYLGVPTIEHIARWPGTRIFTFVSSEEQKTSAPVMEALDPFDGSSRMVVNGSGIHGTRMFGKIPSIEELIANFMESSVADLRVPQWAKDSNAPGEPGFFRKTMRPRRTVAGVTYSMMTYAVGESFSVGALVNSDFKGKVRFRRDGEPLLIPFDTAAKGAPRKVGDVEVSQASAGKTHWVMFSCATPKKLSLEFLPGKGAKVRLPAKTDFVITLQPVK